MRHKWKQVAYSVRCEKCGTTIKTRNRTSNRSVYALDTVFTARDGTETVGKTPPCLVRGKIHGGV